MVLGLRPFYYRVLIMTPFLSRKFSPGPISEGFVGPRPKMDLSWSLLRRPLNHGVYQKITRDEPPFFGSEGDSSKIIHSSQFVILFFGFELFVFIFFFFGCCLFFWPRFRPFLVGLPQKPRVFVASSPSRALLSPFCRGGFPYQNRGPEKNRVSF